MLRQRTSVPLTLPLLLVVFGLLTWPVWRWMWGEWWRSDNYSHGLLIVPLALYLAYRRMRGDSGDPWTPEQGDSRGLLVVAVSLGAFLFFLADRAYYLAGFATIGLIAGLVWTFGGRTMLQRLVFPIGYLVLMVPLPFVERLTLPLALWTGLWSGTLVRWLGLDVAVAGSAVTLPNANLVIGAQCSGINSMMALSALTALAAYALKGPLWGRVALVALALPLAMLGNVLRVANLIVVARYMGVDAAFRYYHDYSGPIFFVLALLLLIPLTRLLRCRTVRFEVL